MEKLSSSRVEQLLGFMGAARRYVIVKPMRLTKLANAEIQDFREFTGSMLDQ
jgi:hypothetical protein